MKKYMSAIVFGCTGVCAGFVLCFLYVVLPQKEAMEQGEEAKRAMTVYSKLALHYDHNGAYFTIPGTRMHDQRLE